MDDAFREDPTELPTTVVSGGRAVSDTPSAGARPSSTSTVTVPAQLRFLEVIRRSASVTLDDSGGDKECTRDVQLAVDELASILILAATIPGELRLEVGHDGTNARLRMQVPVALPGFHPQVAELTRLLLNATADAYDVRTTGLVLTAVMERRLDSTTSP